MPAQSRARCWRRLILARRIDRFDALYDSLNRLCYLQENLITRRLAISAPRSKSFIAVLTTVRSTLFDARTLQYMSCVQDFHGVRTLRCGLRNERRIHLLVRSFICSVVCEKLGEIREMSTFSFYFLWVKRKIIRSLEPETERRISKYFLVFQTRGDGKNLRHENLLRMIGNKSHLHF